MSKYIMHLYSALFSIGLTAPASSAEFLVPPSSSILYVLGEMKVSDLGIFAKSISEEGVTTVAFDSDGGHLGAGIRMGKIIRARGLNTLILKGRDCASSCAIAFIHGISRKMEEGSRIGFHLPSVELTAENTAKYCEQISPEKLKGKSEQLPFIAGVISSDCIANTYGLAMKDAVFFIELFKRIDIGENILLDMLKTPPTEMKWYTAQEAITVGLLTN